MSAKLLRAGLVLSLLAGLRTQGFALDEKKWCSLTKLSSKDYTFTITDWKAVVGNIYLKKKGETGEGTKLSTAKASAVLNAKTEYLCYFDPTAKCFAITFAIGIGDDSTEINIKRAPSVGDRMVVLPKKTMGNSPVTISLSGFRRLNGPAFLTINEMK